MSSEQPDAPKRVCPILRAGDMAAAGAGGYGGRDECMKEECEWWTEGRCAVRALEGIFSRLNSIYERMA